MPLPNSSVETDSPIVMLVGRGSLWEVMGSGGWSPMSGINAPPVEETLQSGLVLSAT